MKKILNLIVFLLVANSLAFAETELAENNNTFAINLYHQIKDNKDNIFFSPYSISSALAMCYAGARGNTQKEMAAVLHFPLEQEQLHKDFFNLNLGLEKIQKKRYVELNVANSLWVQKNHEFLSEYLSITKKYYKAKIENVDFEHDTEGSRQKINAWTEAKTNNLIKEIIPEGSLDPSLTKLVLVNAIYFKGEWLEKFGPSWPEEEDFWITQAQAKKVFLMSQYNYFEYGEYVDMQVLILPYKGNDLSMAILLPKAKDGIKKLEDKLTTEYINKWIAYTKNQKIIVLMPKFKIESSFGLKEFLTALGMNDAFTMPGADFSGMDGSKLLGISEVLHKTWVKVDEEGTEAAAATTDFLVGAAPPRVPPTIFRADHPFIFLIRDNISGSILFMGRLNDPTEK